MTTTNERVEIDRLRNELENERLTAEWFRRVDQMWYEAVRAEDGETADRIIKRLNEIRARKAKP